MRKDVMKETNGKMNVIHDLVMQSSGGQELNIKGVKGPVSVGVDLGTSSIVLIVTDVKGEPVFAASRDADCVKDGLVVKYLEAVRIVRELKMQAEEALGIELTEAAGAIPPGTYGNNKRAVQNVIESADMECTAIVDEPEAAAYAMKIRDGAVVDIGGGTTGISIFEKGKMVFSEDEPTGGTQMTLVVAGALGVPIPEGEKYKRDHHHEKDTFVMIRPVIDKMAAITQNFIERYGKKVKKVYLVGGATNFEEFESVFEKRITAQILKPEYPEFVTPLGIALKSAEQKKECEESA
ncbi:MAG: ethanolamine utilization protein EutJ [Lachnospiraceae bacterium]|nr:ethanolamine utilization protein EutJ [Lachnospiraceae bacterium]